MSNMGTELNFYTLLLKMGVLPLPNKSNISFIFFRKNDPLVLAYKLLSCNVNSIKTKFWMFGPVYVSSVCECITHIW